MALIPFEDLPNTSTPINASNLNNNFDYLKDKSVGTVLYNNTSGTNESVTLSDSAANYDYIEVFYGYSSTSGVFMSSIKVYRPNGKLIGPIMAITSPTNVYIVTARLNFSASYLNFIANNEVTIKNSGNVSIDDIRQISIFRVVGYK